LPLNNPPQTRLVSPLPGVAATLRYAATAADALVAAAEKFDERTLDEIFGPGGEDVVFSGEYAQDRQRAADFAAEAHEKKSISTDPQRGNRAFLVVGNEDWPFPVPIVKRGNTWSFDARAGAKSSCTAASAEMNWTLLISVTAT